MSAWSADRPRRYDHMDEIDALVAELPDEIVDYIGDLQDSVEELTKRLDAEFEEDDDTDPIEKALGSMNPDAAAVIQEKLARLDALEETVYTSAIEKADSEYIAKARAFDGLGNPLEIGPALRRLAEVSPEDADLIEKALSAAAEQTKTSDLYEELGHAIAKSGDAETQVHAIAKSMQDADPSLSEEEARSIAWERNPELYDEHFREQQAKQR
jgi:hypothetical protein